MTVQVKAPEKNFHVVLFILLYKMVLTFESTDESNSLNIVLPCGTVYYAVQSGSNFQVNG